MADLYGNWFMPFTREVQVDYLLRRQCFGFELSTPQECSQEILVFNGDFLCEIMVIREPGSYSLAQSQFKPSQWPPCSFLSLPSLPKPPRTSNQNPFSISIIASRSPVTQPVCSLSSSTATATLDDLEPMSIDNFRRFFDLNMGKWTGSFLQFDGRGNLMQKVSTKLAVSSYGEDELMSLIQTLYIKQPPSSASMPGYEEETEWAEYKIKETNMFTVDKYQQTAGMLETVLRQGILGEDDTEEESPKNLKIPSRQPSIVCENCLYSKEKDRRVRAFHIMDPKGVLEMLLSFLEDIGDGVLLHPSLDSPMESIERIIPFLGNWKGHSITKRSGVYGATVDETDTVALLEMDDRGQLIQDINSTSGGRDVTTNVHWTGNLSDNLVTFDGGYQMTLLPGGMYMGCPRDIAKNVAESKSFHLEFCWVESPGKRQRLVRRPSCVINLFF
ncbi:hypothetical protein HS088_TW15G01075 [Tripterygium wilfordii]|uniref:DUF3598 domain-containing protein n=1 Tax=Tripterygium wilfordii TaxID=458696 RepID=A0A7J7CNA3_TRIWF|nr:hypothetical protein HS088_TW15G01075 [Tripterygium wilfordii]